MIMDYNEALEFIHGTNKFGMKLGLDNMRDLLEVLGNPHRELKCIHIAGTNGKGSTSALINSILVEAGYRVGLFISPYLEEFTERIQINGNPIEREELAEITMIVKDAIQLLLSKGRQHPTEFEIVTAIGLVYFKKREVDFVVLEVGLGGRLDATNIIDQSEVSIITSIGWDHTEQLGDSLEEIASEKAGIIKKRGRVVLYPQNAGVSKVIKSRAKQLEAEFYPVEKGQVELLSTSIQGQCFSYRGEILSLPKVEIGLLGSHQIYNAATALRGIEVLMLNGHSISEHSVIQGLSNAKWPGRFEIIQRDPLIILDGAHNPQGARAFSQAVLDLFPDSKFLFVLGILRDKKVDGMLQELLPLAKEVITVAPDNPRACPPKVLAEMVSEAAPDIRVHPMDTIEKVIEYIKGYGREEKFAFTGSLYMIGEVRKYFHPGK